MGSQRRMIAQLQENWWLTNEAATRWVRHFEALGGVGDDIADCRAELLAGGGGLNARAAIKNLRDIHAKLGANIDALVKCIGLIE